MKKLIAALAAIAVGAGVLISPVSAADADPADNEVAVVSSADDSGYCGKEIYNITWTYEAATETLTLSGTGNMKNFGQGAAPWYDHSSIRTIIIEDGITSIGTYSFYGLNSLTSISIPEGVTSIGADAIEYCPNLRSVDIPDTVTNIADFAFWDCHALEEVTLPASVSYVGWGAFGFCKALRSVTVMNPKCTFYEKFAIFNDTTNHTAGSTLQEGDIYYNGVIYGYEGSTAQTFATKYEYTFESLGEAPSGFGGSGSGDVDGSGSADSTDASLVLKEYACISTGQESSFSEEQNSAADVNTDNVIDSSDASVILRYYAYIATGGTGSLPEYISQ